MTDQLKTEWELRADLEAEERRARQIMDADAIMEMQQQLQAFDAGIKDKALRP